MLKDRSHSHMCMSFHFDICSFNGVVSSNVKVMFWPYRKASHHHDCLFPNNDWIKFRSLRRIKNLWQASKRV